MTSPALTSSTFSARAAGGAGLGDGAGDVGPEPITLKLVRTSKNSVMTHLHRLPPHGQSFTWLSFRSKFYGFKSGLHLRPFASMILKQTESR